MNKKKPELPEIPNIPAYTSTLLKRPEAIDRAGEEQTLAREQIVTPEPLKLFEPEDLPVIDTRSQAERDFKGAKNIAMTWKSLQYMQDIRYKDRIQLKEVLEMALDALHRERKKQGLD